MQLMIDFAPEKQNKEMSKTDIMPDQYWGHLQSAELNSRIKKIWKKIKKELLKRVSEKRDALRKKFVEIKETTSQSWANVTSGIEAALQALEI